MCHLFSLLLGSWRIGFIYLKTVPLESLKSQWTSFVDNQDPAGGLAQLRPPVEGSLLFFFRHCATPGHVSRTCHTPGAHAQREKQLLLQQFDMPPHRRLCSSHQQIDDSIENRHIFNSWIIINPHLLRLRGHRAMRRLWILDSCPCSVTNIQGVIVGKKSWISYLILCNTFAREHSAQWTFLRVFVSSRNIFACFSSKLIAS